MSDPLVSPHSSTLRDRWLLGVLEGVLDEDTIQSLESSSARSVWEAITTKRLFDDRGLVSLVARHFHLPIANLDHVSSQALELIPERWARRFGV
ncbi:MAG TPA: hypothetical protein VJW73_11910, partial [Gemmatimonadaceae bacterium]|nr:hypothetical protein [Gemmatimonadaceae bacterium]